MDPEDGAHMPRAVVGGQLEVARGWLHKLRHRHPHRWECRLFILQDTATLAYFCEKDGGTLEMRGLVRVFSCKQQLNHFYFITAGHRSVGLACGCSRLTPKS